ncbi:MAG: class I SAM-dependent methyltransferase [Candidatus Competibacter sp.]
MLKNASAFMESGYLPDWLIRIGVRRLWVDRANPPFVTLQTQFANIEHAELPVGFFQNVLGPRLHYSAGWWPDEARDLETAEAAMLALICERAELGFDQDILELGCGWGSLTLWLAEFYPDSRFVAVSTSRSQRDFIEARCRERGFTNVRATVGPNDLAADRRFDRVLSVATFERRPHDPGGLHPLHGRLKLGGKLFVQTDGLQPGGDLPSRFQHGLKLEDQWPCNGRHYQRTLEAWLANLDQQRDTILALFRPCYGPDQAERWLQRWRILFMARAERFGRRAGERWGVSHYRFSST